MEQLHSTLALCFLIVFIFDGVTPSSTPDASLLCISECGTCPLICSPPPPSVESKPPSAESKPPKSPTPVDSEPPPYFTPIYHPTPPQSYNFPPPRPRAKSCPPPSYITMGTNAPPPPPPPKLVVVPSTQIPPSDGMEQTNFSYPYYYFYASDGVAFSQRFLTLFTGFYFIFLFNG